MTQPIEFFKTDVNFQIPFLFLSQSQSPEYIPLNAKRRNSEYFLY